MKETEANQPTNLHEACTTTPLGRAIHFLGDSWILLIVMNLLQGSMRFNTLRATLGHISSKTLSSRLKLLEELDFVQRLAFLEIPPRVEYHLTAKGRELVDVIAALEQFGNKHLSNAPATYEQCITADEESISMENAR
ncbi:MAG TPA: helix-turn-helix domain-containing protein [Ktedonobacteraceae bacterium]